MRDAMNPKHIAMLFEIMDKDLDVGVLSLDDLVEGFSRFAQEGVPIEVKQIIGLLHSAKMNILQVMDKSERMEREIAGLSLVSGVTEDDKEEGLQVLDAMEYFAAERDA